MNMYNLKTKFISIEGIIIKILTFSNIKKILKKNKERRKMYKFLSKIIR